jgi:hypothetical protein
MLEAWSSKNNETDEVGFGGDASESLDEDMIWCPLVEGIQQHHKGALQAKRLYRLQNEVLDSSLKGDRRADMELDHFKD